MGWLGSDATKLLFDALQLNRRSNLVRKSCRLAAAESVQVIVGAEWLSQPRIFSLRQL